MIGMGSRGIYDLMRRTVFDDFKGALNSIKGTMHMMRHYKWRRKGIAPERPMVVFMVDRYFYSGGMADRFKGAVTAYAYCKQRGIDYRICYEYPFDLSDYLSPASYDWRLKEGELTDCIMDSSLMYARAEHGRRLLRKKLGNRQLHFYGNYNNLELLNARGGTDYRWGELFRELFRPGQALEDALEREKEKIGPDYVSAVFRFQNLLGDFKEYSFSRLEDEARCEEIKKTCLVGIRILQARFPDVPVLVTSDSSTFLKLASEIPGVHTISGKVVHMGSAEGEDFNTYLKSFVDFYMLAGSRNVFALGTEEMYCTQFPMYAAMVNDVPFERITL